MALTGRALAEAHVTVRADMSRVAGDVAAGTERAAAAAARSTSRKLKDAIVAPFREGFAQAARDADPGGQAVGGRLRKGLIGKLRALEADTVTAGRDAGTGLDKGIGSKMRDVAETAAKGGTTAGKRFGESTGKSIQAESGYLSRIMKSTGGQVFGAFAAAQAGAAVVEFFKGAVSGASDLAEAGNKLQVLFGSSTSQIVEWAKGAATGMGLSQLAAEDAAATFGVFAKSAGLAGAQAAGFSTKMVGLAGDLASFYNTSPADAIEAIGAALRGESEPIRRYGILLDDATLRQRALTLGIVATTTQALTPQQRVLAAQAEIMAQSSAAQGDFARTSTGLANQQRILAAEFANVQAQIGEKLLPVALKLTTILGSGVIPAIGGVINILSAIPGPVYAAVAAMVAARLAVAGLGAAGNTFRSWNGVAGIVGGLRFAASGLLGVLGGPWGIALTGAAAGIALFAKSHQDAEAAEQAFRATLDQTTGALTAQTRVMIVQKLQQDGVLDSAQRLGLGLGVVAAAAMGNVDAQNQVSTALAGVTAGQEEYVRTGARGGVVLDQTARDARKVADAVGGQSDQIRGQVAALHQQQAAQAQTTQVTKDAAAVEAAAKAAADAKTQSIVRAAGAAGTQTRATTRATVATAAQTREIEQSASAYANTVHQAQSVVGATSEVVGAAVQEAQALARASLNADGVALAHKGLAGATGGAQRALDAYDVAQGRSEGASRSLSAATGRVVQDAIAEAGALARAALPAGRVADAHARLATSAGQAERAFQAVNRETDNNATGLDLAAAAASRDANATASEADAKEQARQKTMALSNASSINIATNAANAAGVKYTEEKYKAASKALGDWLTKMATQQNQFLGLSGAQINYQQALDDATAAIKANGRTLDINTAAGRANQTALNGVASSSTEVLKKMVEHGARGPAIRGEWEQQRRKLLAVAGQFGLNKTAALNYVNNALGKIPPEVKTKIVTPGMIEAQRAVAKFRTQILSLQGKNVEIRVNSQGNLIQHVTTRGDFAGNKDGGKITGPGGPRSDSILRRLSDGEFVVNAADTARNLPLLEAINAGGAPGKMARGGPVSRDIKARTSVRVPTPPNWLALAEKQWLGTAASRLYATGGGPLPGGSGVTRWAPMMTRALLASGLPVSLLPNELRQIATESGGNPRAIQGDIGDVNNASGDLAKGLLQVIGSTFRAYHVGGTSWDVFDAWANMMASLNYQKARYDGNIAGVIGHGHGYAAGTQSAAPGWGWVGENGRELVNFGGGGQEVKTATASRAAAGDGLLRLHPDTVAQLGAVLAAAVARTPIVLDGRTVAGYVDRSMGRAGLSVRG